MNQTRRVIDTMEDTTAVVPNKTTKIKGSIDHLAISESLGYQIHRKVKKNKWSAEEDDLLKRLIFDQFVSINHLSKYSNEKIDPDVIDWSAIQDKMGNRKAKECKKRWMGSVDPHLRKGKWTPEEDQLLVQAYKKYGASWQKIALEIEGRNDDQCSKRYTEVLHSDTSERLKKWSMDEDKTLIDGVKTYGTKWRTIATSLPGRPSLTCRNRWRKIMTDIGRGVASDEIKKAVGVLDEQGRPLILFQRSQASNEIAATKRKAQSPLENGEILKKNKLDDLRSSSSNSPKVFSPPISTVRYGTPSHNLTEWKYSLVDPSTSEDISQFSGSISTNEIAQKLVELAKFNGVNITVHQHIHHHYSSSGSPQPHEPQASAHRFSHFNYLPPLTEVPKLTSSSSPDNTVDSNNSNKDPSLLKLLNKNTNTPPPPQQPSNNNTTNKHNDNNNETNKYRTNIEFSRRQQFFASTNIVNNGRNNTSNNATGSMSPSTLHNLIRSKSPTPADLDKPKTGNYLTEDLEEELDFWEAMRSITQPKISNTKPVSQHHPLHYTQPSTFKSQSPYQTSDTFGVSRFPNMASPSVPSTPQGEYKRTVPSVNNITNKVNENAHNFGGIYANGDDEDEDEEEDMDIANQYGMYYSVLQGQQQVNQNQQQSHANSLANSGYLMPFNPS